MSTNPNPKTAGSAGGSIHYNHPDLANYAIFKEFIDRQLLECGIDNEYRKCFTDAESMEVFAQAFTHETFNHIKNYEVLEFVGDGYVKAVLCTYITQRWPNLRKSVLQKDVRPGTLDEQGAEIKRGREGVYSKLRIKLESERTLSVIAQRRGFSLFFRADEKNLTTNKNKLLEDVFEAFVGALIQVVDTKVEQGLGFYYVQKYLTKILNDSPETNIDITYETLVDPVSRLNELYAAKRYKNPALAPLEWITPATAKGPGPRKSLKDFILTTTHSTISTDQLPLTGVRAGSIALHMSTKRPMYFNGQTWADANEAPAGTRMWPITVEYVADASGNEGPVEIDPEQLAHITHVSVLDGARRVIGHGFSIEAKKAKEIAAAKALEYMKSKGYEAISKYDDIPTDYRAMQNRGPSRIQPQQAQGGGSQQFPRGVQVISRQPQQASPSLSASAPSFVPSAVPFGQRNFGISPAVNRGQQSFATQRR